MGYRDEPPEAIDEFHRDFMPPPPPANRRAKSSKPPGRFFSWINRQLSETWQVLENPEGRKMDWSHDWCRWRHRMQCYFPRTVDADLSHRVGETVWAPFDRGYCPLHKWDDQRQCEASEPGEESGHPRAQVNVILGRPPLTYLQRIPRDPRLPGTWPEPTQDPIVREAEDRLREEAVALPVSAYRVGLLLRFRESAASLSAKSEMAPEEVADGLRHLHALHLLDAVDETFLLTTRGRLVVGKRAFLERNEDGGPNT